MSHFSSTPWCGIHCVQPKLAWNLWFSYPSLLGAEVRNKCHTWLLLHLFFHPNEFMPVYCVLVLLVPFVIAILLFETGL